MASVFLSYDRDDAEPAHVVVAALEDAGHSVWWDRQIKAGAQYTKAIEAALHGAKAIVVLWSGRSVDSAWVRDEAAIGRDDGRLVPVSLDRTPPPLGFRQYQSIPLSSDQLGPGSPGMAALLDAVADLTQTGGARTSARQVPARAGGSQWLTRRNLVVGAAAAVAATGGASWLLLRDRETAAPPEVQALLAQAWQAWTRGSDDGRDQAIGLYLRAAEIAPDHADTWGLLACVYADKSHGQPVHEREALRERSREAGRRALRLDPRNGAGRVALAYARPIRGNWALMEREFRGAMRDHPGEWLLPYSLAIQLTRVGRLSEAAALFDRIRGNAPTAFQYYFHITSLWGSGQVGEAERLLREANAIFARTPMIWNTHFDMLLFSGRAATAAALAEDPATWPSGLADDWFARRAAVARAVLSRNRQAADALAAELMQEARQSASRASRWLNDLAALGRADETFAAADAYFFSRGFAIPDGQPAPGQAASVTLEWRLTGLLFLPPMLSLRADPRFGRLMADLGLERYWREVGVQPDYRRA